jgi:hypothetical protein
VIEVDDRTGALLWNIGREIGRRGAELTVHFSRGEWIVWLFKMNTPNISSNKPSNMTSNMSFQKRGPDLSHVVKEALMAWDEAAEKRKKD